VIVELSPIAYMTLCGLVKDALQHPSDASFLLKKVAEELSSATAGGMIPSDLLEEPDRIENLREAGFVAR
jgi:hypothetical protein